jgi:hypothetical protein
MDRVHVSLKCQCLRVRLIVFILYRREVLELLRLKARIMSEDPTISYY